MEPIDFIRTTPPFHHLNDLELAQVEAHLEIVHYTKPTLVLTQGSAASDYLNMVRAGEVRLLRDGQVTQVLEAGEYFGYVSMLGDTAPVSDVVAGANTTLYRIPETLFRILIDNVAFAEFYLKGLSDRLRRSLSSEHSTLGGDLITPVRNLISGPPLFLAPTATVQEAAQIMRDAHVSSVLIQADLLGIITDRDLRSRVLAEGLPVTTLVQTVMTQPAKTLPADTLIYSAIQFLLQENIHHLPLEEDGRIVGVVSSSDLVRHQARSPIYLLQQLDRLDDERVLARYATEAAATVDSLFQGGLDVVQIGRIIANLNDTLIQRLLRLAETELGPPPVPYAWIVFGSEGRMEQTLLTDQDNALIFQDSPDGDGQTDRRAEAYFTSLAAKVVTGLIRAGFPPCPGGYMATHWCKPLSAWTELFQDWIQTPTPQALMEAAIFFDFRTVYGDLGVDGLDQLLLEAGGQGLFMRHLAHGALGFRPPLGLFHRIRDEGGLVDIKKGAIASVVSMARVYALEARSLTRSTTDRIEAAAQANTLSRQGAEDLAQIYRFLLHLRLRQQLQNARSGKVMDNNLRLDSLSVMEKRHLKEAFVLIKELQDSIEMHFQTAVL